MTCIPHDLNITQRISKHWENLEVVAWSGANAYLSFAEFERNCYKERHAKKEREIKRETSSE